MGVTQNKQAGFNIVELLVMIVAVGVIGAGGWFVYQHNRTKPTDAASNPTNQQTQQTTTTTQPAPTVSYLTIKEWGIKLPLSSSIQDAYYVPDTNVKSPDGITDQVYVGLKSLDADNCAAAGSLTGQSTAPAMIIRVLPTATDPVSGDLLTQKYPNGVTIGSYYYAYLNLAAGSGNKCKAPTASLQSLDAGLSASAKSTVSATAAN